MPAVPLVCLGCHDPDAGEVTFMSPVSKPGSASLPPSQETSQELNLGPRCVAGAQPPSPASIRSPRSPGCLGPSGEPQDDGQERVDTRLFPWHFRLLGVPCVDHEGSPLRPLGILTFTRARPEEDQRGDRTGEDAGQRPPSPRPEGLSHSQSSPAASS